MCTHTHTHTHTLTLTQAHSHTHTHTHTHTHSHSHTLTVTQSHIHIHTHKYTLKRSHTHTFSITLKYIIYIQGDLPMTSSPTINQTGSEKRLTRIPIVFGSNPVSLLPRNVFTEEANMWLPAHTDTRTNTQFGRYTSGDCVNRRGLRLNSPEGVK